jgi:hypothetical protein
MTIRAELDARYNFTLQYLATARQAALQAGAIERRYANGQASDAIRVKHLGFSTTAVFHSYAALEAEIWSILNHGPGHHLGSNGIDRAAVETLKPLIKLLDREDILNRCQIMLQVLKKPVMPVGQGVAQDLRILARVRNELVHYKSRWNRELTEEAFVRGLRSKNFAVPPFRRDAPVYFPLQVLGASCAAWCVQTAFDFLRVFYDQLGVHRPLGKFRSAPR